MIRNVKALTASSYLCMCFVGLAATIIGAAARNIGLSPYQIGVMLAVQNVGFMVSVSVAGALADTVEKPRILLVGSLVLGASLLVFFASQAFWVSLVAMFFIGAGTGAFEGVTDAMLIDLHAGKESLHISINHFFATFGSIMITLYLMFLQMSWRNSVIQSAIVALLLAAFFGLARLESRGNGGESYGARFKILVRERTVVVLFICTALAVGVELGTVGILTTYLMDLRAFSQVTSKIGLLVFLFGIVTGRLLVGFFVKKEKMPQSILALSGLAFVLFTALFALNLKDLTYVPIYLAGVSLSAMLPLILTVAGLKYKHMAGTVMGAIKVAIPLGGILIPFLMSLVTRNYSFEMSLFVFPVAFLIMFLLILTERRRLQI